MKQLLLSFLNVVMCFEMFQNWSMGIWGRKLFAGVNLCYKDLNSQTKIADLLYISSSLYNLLAVINS